MLRREFLFSTAAALSAAAAPPPPFDPAFASAREAALAIRSKKISSVELTTETWRRIDKYNPKLNAIIWPLRESSLNEAKAADAALAGGRTLGLLHGVPVHIKESFHIAGAPSTWGVPEAKEWRAKTNAVVVERLRNSGAVILGKTNIPLMLMDQQSYNGVYGTTNNPWNLAYTPGGSTGGGAAALAAGLGFAAMGSDIGGSIRVPAHFCGIHGLKPTFELVPMIGHAPAPYESDSNSFIDLAVAGPLARHPADLHDMLSIVAGPGPYDNKAYRWTPPAPRHKRLADFRVGYVLDEKLCPVSSDIRPALEQALRVIEKSGAKLVKGWPGGLNPQVEYDNYLYLLGAMSGDTLPDADRDMVASTPKETAAYAFGLGMTQPHQRWVAETRRRYGLRGLWEDYFRDVDVFLSPVSFTAAFRHNHDGPVATHKIDTPEGQRPFMDSLFWIHPATVAGLPAVSAPVGLTKEGLPVGIQITAPYLEDPTAIEFAVALATVTGGFKAPAGYA